jgi:hypothetical protein
VIEVLLLPIMEGGHPREDHLMVVIGTEEEIDTMIEEVDTMIAGVTIEDLLRTTFEVEEKAEEVEDHHLVVKERTPIRSPFDHTRKKENGSMRGVVRG